MDDGNRFLVKGQVPFRWRLELHHPNGQRTVDEGVGCALAISFVTPKGDGYDRLLVRNVADGALCVGQLVERVMRRTDAAEKFVEILGDLWPWGPPPSPPEAVAIASFETDSIVEAANLSAAVIETWKVWKEKHDVGSARFNCCSRTTDLFDAIEAMVAYVEGGVP